jgi:hypothetical protein
MPTTSRTFAMSTTTIGALILRDDWTCAYCGRRFNEETISSLVFDHVIPRDAPGYSPRPENIVVACNGCNIWKSDYGVEESFGAATAIEVARRCAIYIGVRGGPRARELRRLGRDLGDRLYPWAREYRANEARRNLARYHARRAEAARDGVGGAGHFPFGALAQEKTCKFSGRA